jgi:hypothetical protein
MLIPTASPEPVTTHARWLTPLQNDVLLVAATPQLYGWPERWVAPSVRQDAIAWGLVRRGLLRELPKIPGGYEATPLGQCVASLLIADDLAEFERDALASGL